MSGERFEFDWKALMHRSGSGWWEFMDVLIALDQLKPGVCLHDWWFKQKSFVQSTATSLNLALPDLVRPSKKSLISLAKRNGQPVDLPDDARDGWLVSTRGVIIIAQCCLMKCRQRKAKAQARGILDAFLQKLVHLAFVKLLLLKLLHDILESYRSRCICNFSSL